MTTSEFVTTSDDADSARRRPVHRLRVCNVIRETADAISLVFDVPGAAENFRYEPGQFLTLKIPSTETGSVSRCYSLSSSPHADSLPAVTIKRTADGFASNWLCDNATAEMMIESLAPSGAFVPKTWDADFVLLAAGSGITPMMSIIKSALAEHANTITLVYANRTTESVIFADQLADLGRRYPDRLTVHHWLESQSGLPTPQGLKPWLHGLSDNVAYLCGPAPFMQIGEESLLAAGMPGERVHREVFRSLATNPFEVTRKSPLMPAAAGSAASAAVELEGENHTVAWPRETVLLDALLDRGIDAPYVCREGSCGGCAYTLLRGEVRMLLNDTLDDHELARGVRLACQSLPVSDDVDVVFE
ncbi:ferredoxin--NADP reductase [Rhodococcus erythropolis]|uniref:ferredoxin--NADP reductase n=1 Tax=Rhodococcus erythropolis TaxID=1833 RepID=UPI001BE8055D|nr:ferredoxin--NADP reductase [Rhodococcus erythropolis]MBT2269844.1 ferredoxin--NADP reductase [Rhodococcus erythropolis]